MIYLLLLSWLTPPSFGSNVIPKHIFGSLNLTAIPEEQLSIPYTKRSEEHIKGVSLSLRLDRVASTNHSQKILSLQGIDVFLHHTPERKCLLKLATKFKFDITYTLSSCDSKSNVIVDLYSNSQITASVYENLQLLRGDEVRGWCKFDNTSLAESIDTNYKLADFSFDSSTYTITEVQNKCLSKTIQGQPCRGVTLQGGSYTLRVGDVPLAQPHHVSWLNGPCSEQDSNVTVVEAELTIYRTSYPVLLSHINLDPLESITYKHIATQRWMRYQMGNLVPGNYMNYMKIPYNTPIGNSIPYTSFYAGDIRNVSLRDGMFLTFDWGYEFGFTIGKRMQAINAWIYNNHLYVELSYCAHKDHMQLKHTFIKCLMDGECCGVYTNGTMIMSDQCNGINEELAMEKGLCHGDRQRHLVKDHLKPDATLTFSSRHGHISAIYLKPLMEETGLFSKNRQEESCWYNRTKETREDITGVVTFTTSENGYKIKTGDEQGNDKTMSFSNINKTSDQQVLQKVTISPSVTSIWLNDDDECTLDMKTFHSDFCNGRVIKDNYGNHFLRRAVIGETVEIDCLTQNDNGTYSKALWKCGQNGRWNNEQQCPFYQCISSVAHNPRFSNNSNFVPHKRKGQEMKGDCCGGSWYLTCEENITLDYSGCEPLQPCVVQEQFVIRVGENGGWNSSREVVASQFIAANDELSVPCEYSSGVVTLECDGCTGQRSVISNTCRPQFCVRDGDVETLDLSWNLNHTTKYGIDFVQNITGPFTYQEFLNIPCPNTGYVVVGCKEGALVRDYTKCKAAPQCDGVPYGELHPLKGRVVYRGLVFAGETIEIPCPYNNEAMAFFTCNTTGNWTGITTGNWTEPDHEMCEMTQCADVQFTHKSVRFNTWQTQPNTLSKTECSVDEIQSHHQMCKDGSCGARLCNDTTGEYNPPNYATCQFNCTYTDRDYTDRDRDILHSSYISLRCVRGDGDKGVRYVGCRNGDASLGPCLLKTCPYEGGMGCVETDLGKLKKMDTSELVADLDSFLDSIDLSDEGSKEATKNVVSVVVSKSTKKSTEMSVEAKVAVAGVVDKVSQSLAKLGGEIVTDKVKMVGLPATGETTAALADNGISGSGFDGSIGLAVYKDTDMFTPNNTDKQRLGSKTVKSITTSNKSGNISVVISFPLTRAWNKSALACGYYDTNTGLWEGDGCTAVVLEGSNELACQCSHLTSFAVLVSMDKIDSDGQSIATHVALWISIGFLALTIVSVTPFKKLRNRQIMQLHIALVSTYLAADIAFISLDAAIGSSPFCHFVTFLTHYAWLAVFGWMVAEGFTMYSQTVRALKSYGKKDEYYLLKCAGCVFGGSAVFPLTGLILHLGWPEGFQYVDPDTDFLCFLAKPLSLSVLFLGPLYLVLAVAVFFVVRVSTVVVKANRMSMVKKKRSAVAMKTTVDTTEYLKKQGKAVLSIATVTGMGWLVAPLVLFGGVLGDTAGSVFQWLFIVLIGLHGLTTFIVLVLLGDEVKGCWSDAYTGSGFEKFADETYNSVSGVTTLYRKMPVPYVPPSTDPAPETGHKLETLPEE